MSTTRRARDDIRRCSIPDGSHGDAQPSAGAHPDDALHAALFAGGPDVSDLTAVDILLEPDATMLALAARFNARMLSSIPSPPGFALDESHRPHVTALQRYVRTAALDDVYAAIEGVLASVDLSSLMLAAHTLTHVEVEPSVGIGVIIVAPGPEVVDFQTRLIEALLPFTAAGGTADAFVRTDAEPDINDKTIEFIENYVPQHSGKEYVAHVSVGIAKLDDLTTFEAEPFEPLTFSAAAVGIYQLGNNGTAARKLKTWDTAKARSAR